MSTCSSEGTSPGAILYNPLQWKFVKIERDNEEVEEIGPPINLTSSRNRIEGLGSALKETQPYSLNKWLGFWQLKVEELKELKAFFTRRSSIWQSFSIPVAGLCRRPRNSQSKQTKAIWRIEFQKKPWRWMRNLLRSHLTSIDWLKPRSPLNRYRKLLSL